MTEAIDKLSDIFSRMVKNHETFGMQWANIPLGKEAFEIMKQLPDTMKDEFETPADKGAFLCRMLEFVEESNSPRFCIEVREYAAELFGEEGDEDNDEALERLRDYINVDFPMEDYCRKHGKFLHFDPIERTERWEKVIYDVLEECDRRMKGEIQRMGYCFTYWSTMAEVLGEYGIPWRSPSLMNPRVMFD